MNLHGIVSGAVSAVNPSTLGTLKVNTGSTKQADGSRTPSYKSYPKRAMQIQQMSSRDLQQIEGLNLGGEKRKIYFYGEVNAVVRSANQGGDLVVIESGVHAGTWLIVQSIEAYPDWCSVVAVLQNGS
jgi:hypothetical protein